MSKKVPKLPTTNGPLAKLCQTMMLMELIGTGHHLAALTPETLEKEIDEGLWPNLVKVAQYGRCIDISSAELYKMVQTLRGVFGKEANNV